MTGVVLILWCVLVQVIQIYKILWVLLTGPVQYGPTCLLANPRVALASYSG